MNLLKKYRFGFDIWALLLFMAIMIPNFIWFGIPAPNDVLRADSVTEIFDTAASVCQVLMVMILCTLINREREKIIMTPLIIAVFICCILYYTSWVMYYFGLTNAAVILGLTIPPCLAFLLFAVDRKNRIAVIPITVFTICHLVYGIVNFGGAKANR